MAWGWLREHSHSIDRRRERTWIQCWCCGMMVSKMLEDTSMASLWVPPKALGIAGGWGSPWVSAGGTHMVEHTWGACHQSCRVQRVNTYKHLECCQVRHVRSVSVCYYYCLPVVLNRSESAIQGPLAMFADSFGCVCGGIQGMLLAASRERQETLLNILQYAGMSPQHRITQPNSNSAKTEKPCWEPSSYYIYFSIVSPVEYLWHRYTFLAK